MHKPYGDSYVMPTSVAQSKRSRRRKLRRDGQRTEESWWEVCHSSGCPSPAELRELIETSEGYHENCEGEVGMEARAAKDAESKDSRSLTVFYDGPGERDWELLCREISVAEFADYLERWAKNKNTEESDRTFHEMKIVMESLEALVSHDQLDRGSLAGVERMCRRLRTLFDAYDVNPALPNFESANLFSEMGAEMYPVGPVVRTHIAKVGRNEAEIERLKQKARELRKAPPPEGGG